MSDNMQPTDEILDDESLDAVDTEAVSYTHLTLPTT